jgi:hypothetical protein
MSEEEIQQGVYVDGIRALVTLEGGRLGVMIRAQTKEIFDAMALSVGIKKYQNPEIPAVIDPETEEVIEEAVPASGPLIASPNVTIHEIGPFVITPGVYDDEGNEIEPPVIDNRYHVNFWLGPRLVRKGLWKQWAVTWPTQGEPSTPNKSERGVVFQGIELIDPLTIQTPSNRLL